MPAGKILQWTSWGELLYIQSSAGKLGKIGNLGVKTMKTARAYWLAMGLLCWISLLGTAALAASPGDPLLKVLEKDYETKVLPPDASIVEVYKDGEGKPCGTAEFVQNDAYIIHKNAPKSAYRAKKGQPVFTGDTLIADAKSSLIVLLNDKSRITLGAYSKLVIDKSVYEEKTNLRDTIVSMFWGKARYVVQKLGGGREDFKVTTPLATLGVRGSDFAVAIVPEDEILKLQTTNWLERFDFITPAWAVPGHATYTLAGADTTLNQTGPGGARQTLTSFSSSVAFSDRLTSPMPVTPSLVPTVLDRVLPRASVMSMPSILE